MEVAGPCPIYNAFVGGVVSYGVTQPRGWRQNGEARRFCDLLQAQMPSTCTNERGGDTCTNAGEAPRYKRLKPLKSQGWAGERYYTVYCFPETITPTLKAAVLPGRLYCGAIAILLASALVHSLPLEFRYSVQ